MAKLDSNSRTRRARTARLVFASLLLPLHFAHADDLGAADRAIRTGAYEEAAVHLERAAHAGDPEAQYRLASLYRMGRGVEANHEQAFRWFEAAARQGHNRAKYNLGVMFEKGWGTPANRDEALRWYRRAAIEGNERAAAKLREDGARSRSSAAVASSAKPVSIGREEENDIALSDPHVSGTHAIVERTETGCRVRDLNSRSGTRVNGLAVKTAVLNRGDEIAIGPIRLVYESDQQPVTDMERERERVAQAPAAEPTPDKKPQGPGDTVFLEPPEPSQ